METFAILRNCGYKIYHIGQFWCVKVPGHKQPDSFVSYEHFLMFCNYFTKREIEKHEN